ncbi:hypothetical protein EVAR_78403_1 [Eumeta japonica]|uniref:Uncharacterized protein n=1 Tax=Eumeta variegata TaxID=151549 RepID=A0A4C1T3I0_EUMVA|nr:hypothetical protein EVAR_78403_1 [Eumeta japonica]
MLERTAPSSYEGRKFCDGCQQNGRSHGYGRGLFPGYGLRYGLLFIAHSESVLITSNRDYILYTSTPNKCDFLTSALERASDKCTERNRAVRAYGRTRTPRARPSLREAAPPSALRAPPPAPRPPSNLISLVGQTRKQIYVNNSFPPPPPAESELRPMNMKEIESPRPAACS